VAGVRNRRRPAGYQRDVNPAFLYVHVPFCTRRCSYCDFAVTAVPAPPVAAWLAAIDGELGGVRAAEGWSGPLLLETIYVGGGTPSVLGGSGMEGLAAVLGRHAAWTAGTVEWTAEANPESFDAATATAWLATGVNRISLGAQSFDSGVLRWMGRLHGADGPARAVAAARAAGFDNVSVDLIFGLPARLGRDWGGELERVLALEPEHISLYGLTAEPATPLGRWVAAGREQLADEAAYAEEYLVAAERLTAAGFRHYEVSNFALPGRESRHNGAYWEGVPYLGLGPGAHSYLPPVRRWNVRDWEAYRGRVAAGESPEEDREVVAEAGELERIWLALRTDRGARLAELGPGAEAAYEPWLAAGWATLAAGRLRLTPEGWLRLDRLTVDLAGARST
jgi:oxygen-independent coproporphyrinogen III oxidase